MLLKFETLEPWQNGDSGLQCEFHDHHRCHFEVITFLCPTPS
jgi:hypothetical protein